MEQLGNRGLCQGVDQEPNGHSNRAEVGNPRRKTAISAALLQAFMVERHIKGGFSVTGIGRLVIAEGRANVAKEVLEENLL